MLATLQLLLMRRARDRAIDVAIAPLGTVILLPDPDFRRRVCRCVSHVGSRLSLDGFAEWIERRSWPVQSWLWACAARFRNQASGIRDQGSGIKIGGS